MKTKLEAWQMNLYVLSCGNFLVMAGMTMIIPFLSLFLKQDLGLTNDHEIGVWAGLIYAANFVTAFFFQPFWGKLADKTGRRRMVLRSCIGMAFVIFLMGFATHPWHLLVLRLINGSISGFVAAAVSLVSSGTPKEQTGFAMGTFQAGGIAGTILGPFIGGLLADAFGFRLIFYVTGILLLLASIVCFIFVQEKFDRKKAAQQSHQSVLSGLHNLLLIRQLPVLLMITFLIQFSLQGPMPLIPLYVEKLMGSANNLAFFAGFVGSVTGISNLISSPLLGKLSDKIGANKILLYSLVGTAFSLIPQAFVGTVTQLLMWRFMLGCFLGGLVPTVNALVRKYTPDGMESRAFSFNTSAMSLGNMLGPVVSGLLTGWLSIEGIFIMSGGFMLLTFAWASHEFRLIVNQDDH